MRYSKNDQQRLPWVDVVRGLLILSVVIGHSTGQYNMYIYQFHMGAFFLISGYLSHAERRGIIETAYNRFFTVFLPLFSTLIMLSLITWLMQLVEVYSIFFLPDQPFLSLKATLEEFILRGNIYVWWLGAGWFLIVLCEASVLNKIILYCSGNRYGFKYIVLLLVLFICGYAAIGKTGHIWYWDLTLLANFYYGVGAITRSVQFLEKMIKKNVLCILGILCSTSILWGVAHMLHLTMDWPSRAFNNPILDTLMVLNGFLCIFFVSTVLEKIAIISKIIQYLGRNTLPIVLFHFMWFNLGYIFLYLVGIVPIEYLQNFVPTTEIGYIYWPLFVLTGVGMSLVQWKIMMPIRYLRILWGQEKHLYVALYTRIREKASAWRLSRNEAIKPAKLRWSINIVGLVFLVLLFHVTQVDSYIAQALNMGREAKGVQVIEFPSTDDTACITGWLPQAENEDYRWVEQISETQLSLPNGASQFIVEGYIPETFTEINSLTVYVDNKVLEHMDVAAGQAVSISKTVDVNALTSEDSVIVKLEFNDEHSPQPGDVDVRVMSALITKIGFESQEEST